MKIQKQKTDAIMEWATPKSAQEMQAFLGLASCCRAFVNSFSTVAAPITAATRRRVKAHRWAEDQQAALQKLKQAFARPPVLQLLGQKKEHMLTTDASDAGLGAVLQQEHADGLPPRGAPLTRAAPCRGKLPST